MEIDIETFRVVSDDIIEWSCGMDKCCNTAHMALVNDPFEESTTAHEAGHFHDPTLCYICLDNEDWQ